MTDEIPTGDPTTVPIGELEELVDEWTHDRPGLITESEYVQDQCAVQLQELIDKYDPKQ